MKLTPCTSCRRLVHVQEASCPFCSAAMGDAPPPRSVGVHVSRALRMIGVAAVGVACGGSTEPTPAVDAGVDAVSKDATEDFATQPPYGHPVLDAAEPDAPMGAYGSPPIDAGTE